MEYGYNGVGQGEHRLAFFQEGPASLPCSYDLSSFCAKSSFGDGVLPALASPGLAGHVVLVLAPAGTLFS